MNSNKKFSLIFLLAISFSVVSAQSFQTDLPRDLPYLTLKQPFFSTQELQAGDIVAFADSQTETEFLSITKADLPYDPQIIGVVIPTMQNENEISNSIATFGEVYVKINLEKEPISKGDFITSSALPGIGMKATSPGFVLGKALENFKPAFSENDSTEIASENGQIKILLSPAWLDQAYFNRQKNIDNLTTAQSINSPTDNQNSNSKTEALQLDKKGNLKLDAALISTGNITSIGETTLLNLYVVGELLANKIQAPAFENLGIWLGDNLGATKLDILDNNGSIQASVDSNGNLKARKATFDHLAMNTQNPSIGRVTLTAGNSKIFVPNHYVSSQSYIFITSLNSTAGQSAYVEKQIPSQGFWLALDFPLSKNVDFNFWIVN